MKSFFAWGRSLTGFPMAEARTSWHAPAVLAFLAVLPLSGCSVIHETGSTQSRDLGVDSQLWREELKRRRIAVVTYTSAINDMPEMGEFHLPMSGPKSSTTMVLHPDKGRRRMFTMLNVSRWLLLGIPPKPWNLLANGVGWNPQTTLDGYPLSLPTNALNEAVFQGSRVAFESLGAVVSRIDASQTEGISLGRLARENHDSIDYLWAVRQTCQMGSDTVGKARYLGEMRGSLFDTTPRRRWGWIFGMEDQPRWIKYRRAVLGPPVEIASWTKIANKQKEDWFRMQFSEDSIEKTCRVIAEQVRKDLTDWPNKDRAKHEAQRPGIPRPSE